MELQGRIKLIGNTQTLGKKQNFKKRDLVLITEEQYPQTILIEFYQDKTDLLNAFKESDMVKIGINLRGREWINPEGEAKYFNQIAGWRIEKVDNNVPDPNNIDVKSDAPAQVEDDLPF